MSVLLISESDLKEFYNTYYTEAVRQAFRIVNDLHEAEDVVQDCIVKLWDKRSSISKDGPVLPYFRRMVRNKSIDMLRRRIPLDNSIDALEIEIRPPDLLEYNELSNKIDGIIDSLPEKCRQVFVLSRFEQMTYKEISEHLNISPKTVENQVSRALKQLRAGLGDSLFSFFF